MNKKRIITIISAALICVSAVGGTFATMSVNTNTKTNSFTVATVGEKGFNAELTEPLWQGNQHLLYPGIQFDKNPMITNISDQNYLQWVAIKVEDGSDGIAKMDTNNIEWTDGDVVGDGIYFYKKVLEKDKTTKPLFTKVSMPKDTSPEQLNSLNGAFDIVVKGAAVQVTETDTTVDIPADEQEALIALFPDDTIA